MRRGISILGVAAITLVGASAVRPGPADASVLCDGKAPTVLTSTGGIIGTEGDDVIVTTSGAWNQVQALGGNDTICLTTPARSASSFHEGLVFAGSGDDVVIVDPATDRLARMRVALGGGHDRYTGGPNDDTVHADADTLSGPGAEVRPPAGPNDDVIDLGDGYGSVVSLAAEGALNNDVLTAAGAVSITYVGAMGPTGSLDVSRASSTFLRFPSPGLVSPLAAGPFLVDNTRRTATVNGVAAMAWTGNIDHFTLGDQHPEDAPDAMSQPVGFTGGDAAEQVTISGPVHELSMGAGHDTVFVRSSETGPTLGRIDGGPGQDSFRLDASCTHLVFRLTGTSKCVSATSGTAFGEVRDMENSSLYLPRDRFSRITATGTAARDRFNLDATDVRLRSGGGRDSVMLYSRRARLWLGSGPDRAWVVSGRRVFLFGQGGNDRLFALPGRNESRRHTVAVGGPGRDLCRAMIVRTCESETKF